MTTTYQIPLITENSMNPIDIIRDQKGKFTKVLYTNQKGETKSYTVRTGVKKHLTGGQKTFVPDAITVYSVTAGNTGYKSFKRTQIKAIIKKKNTIYGNI